MSSVHHARKARVSDQWAWVLRANCRGLLPDERDLFFPDDDFNPPAQQVAAARLFCESCPVKTECLEHALRYESYGIWSGTTPAQRAELRNARRRAAYWSLRHANQGNLF